jgi:hypothetical protein
MTKEFPMTNSEMAKRAPEQAFGFGHPFVIRTLSFVII